MGMQYQNTQAPRQHSSAFVRLCLFDAVPSRPGAGPKFAEYRAARIYTYDTARRIALAKTGQRLDADATKLFASQVAKRTADAAIQVLGGNGYMGEYVVERLWRDAKLLEIGGGTLEAHQKNMTKDLTRDSSILGN